MAHRLAPGSVPAHQTRLGEAEDHPALHPSAPGRRPRPAILADRLDKTPAFPVRAQGPPHGQGRRPQPEAQVGCRLLKSGIACRAPGLEPLDGPLHRLAVGQGCHEDAGAVSHYRQALDPDRHHLGAAGSPDIGSGDALGLDPTLDVTACRVLFRKGVDDIPGTYIRPGEVHFSDHGPGRLFHDRIVDGDPWGGPENLAQQEPCGGLCRRLHSGLRRFQNLGGEASQLVDQGGRRDDEVTAVPKAAFGDEAGCAAGVGLLDEGLDHPHTFAPPRPDIAVGGRGEGRLHPQGDDAASPGEGGRADHGVAEGLGIRDVMVGGEDDHDRLFVPSQQPDRRRRHGRSGIAGFGLKDHLGVEPGLGQLLADQAPVVSPADHQERPQGGGPGGGVLEGRGPVAEQPGEGLGPFRPGGGPEAHPGAAAHDDGIEAHRSGLRPARPRGHSRCPRPGGRRSALRRWPSARPRRGCAGPGSIHRAPR